MTTEQYEVQEAAVQLLPQPAPAPAPAAPPALLITITTPGCKTAICREGTKQELTGDVSVKQLIERATSLRSPLSLAVPVPQLEAEMSTVLTVGELLATGCAEAALKDKAGEVVRVVPLDEPIHNVVREETGEQGNRFWIIDLEVRVAEAFSEMTVEERRQLQMPAVVEASPTPASQAQVPQVDAPAVPKNGHALAEPITLETPAATTQSNHLTVGDDPSKHIVVMATGAPAEPAAAEPKGYIRKTDLLRAQFLPEVEALDLSGLFVCEFGAVIRQAPENRNVVLSDTARITETLLQGNGYRRAGNHSKALTCYQELVDMDPSNADFRFLLGKTLAVLGQEQEAIEAFIRARELGHEGAKKEIEEMRAAGVRGRKPLGFLRFWKQ